MKRWKQIHWWESLVCFSSEMGRIFLYRWIQTRRASSKIRNGQRPPYENTGTLELAGKAALEKSRSDFCRYGGVIFWEYIQTVCRSCEPAFGDKWGFVTDERGHLVWDRINCQPIRNSKDPSGASRCSDEPARDGISTRSTLYEDGDHGDWRYGLYTESGIVFYW